MLKKIISIIITLILIISLIPTIAVNAEEAAGSDSSATQNASSPEVNISAPSALLMDYDTGKILFEKNSHDIRPCASITKVMTLCLIFEAIDAGKINCDTIVTASPIAASMGGSDIWLVEGEQMSVNDLIKAIVVVSANDAAVAMAECVSGSEPAFVEEMNRKAAELGMNDTVFKNCNGLDEDGHVTSAYDVALMSRELMKHDDIYNYTSIWLDYIRDGATQLVNTNKLLKTYDGITGLKTGTTSKAGACISATAQRDGLNLISVILGAANTADRFNDAAALLNYGFANYTSVTPQPPETLPQTAAVTKGMQETADIYCNIDKKFLMKKGAEESLSAQVVLNEDIAAPLHKNNTVGKIIYRSDNEVLGEFPIISLDDVVEINFKDVLAMLVNSFVSF